MLYKIILSLFSLMLLACSKDEGSLPQNQAGMNIDGVLWQPTYANASLSEGGILKIVGTQSISKSANGTERSKEFYIYAQGIRKVGNYDILHKFNVEKEGDVVAKYQDITRTITNVSSTTFIAEKGKLTITRFDANAIEGTFEFSAFTQNPNEERQSVSIEKGKFFLQLK